jgi:tetrahydromethanopterin S-methyltransferase subunit G
MAGGSAQTRLFSAGTPQSNIEKRLDELEKKLDVAISEIRDLSVTVKQVLERLPPKDQ